MRILTYNVHGCRGADGQRDISRIAEVIAAENPDVVCLQELDQGRQRSGGLHQACEIANALRMEFQFHPAVRVADEGYGDAVLSRFPLRLIHAGALPRIATTRFTEPRGAIWVAIAEGSIQWQIITTHLGLGRAERYAQAVTLAGEEWIASAMEFGPVVCCGDLNSRPGSRVHRVLSASLRNARTTGSQEQPPTFSTRFPFICLDYIYVSMGVRVVRTWMPTNPNVRVASDHFPLGAEVLFGG